MRCTDKLCRLVVAAGCTKPGRLAMAVRCTKPGRLAMVAGCIKSGRLVMVAIVCMLLTTGCSKAEELIAAYTEHEEVVAAYEAEKYNRELYRGALFAGNLCTASGDIVPEGILDVSTFHAAAVFDVNRQKVDFACRIHERLYPASTTKIMTALLAVKYADLSASVTVAPEAAAWNFSWVEKTCGIRTGDQLTLRDLLHGLLLESGNDAAVAIAVHMAGSEEAFARMMNEEAARLMATNTQFVNSNGLHSPDHYTTAYDLYLIFNECIKYPEFVNMINTGQYTVQITGADGVVRQANWVQTNYYAAGRTEQPSGAAIIGGKTGTTKEAGNCLILLNRTPDENPYISIVMGADSKELLYQDMTALINGIPAYE